MSVKKLLVYKYLSLVALSLFNGFWLTTGYIFSTAELTLNLSGDQEITLSPEDTFEDPGATATFCLLKTHCRDVSNLVETKTPDLEKIQAHSPGTYEFSYSVSYKKWNLSQTRTVKIPDSAPPELTLNGEENIGLYSWETFEDPGATALDNLDGDISGKISVEGEVINGVSGVYTLTYRVSDASGNSAEKTRHVFVYDWYALNSTPTATFEDLDRYLNDLGLNVSFGFYRFDDGYEFTVNPDKVYYGASLVKTLDAMYAYEHSAPDYATKNLIRNAISYSNNSSHVALVQKYGIDNLRAYAREIGMTHHLTPSQIYSDTYYFCDTTVHDQLAEWKHLWTLINTLPNGGELQSYFINNYWPNLRFNGSPTLMYKNGDYGIWYHEVGIIYAERPYLVATLSTHRQDWRYLRITEDFSHRVYMINQLLD